jgi:MFS superfamily sulfate permease-like transporter
LVAATGLIRFKEFRAARAYHVYALVFALIAFFGVVILGTLEGIVIAALCSVIMLMYYTSVPKVYVVGRKAGADLFRPLEDHPQDETVPGLLLLRIEGLMYFANVSNAIDRVASLIDQYEPRVVAVDCSGVPIFEYTAVKQLREFADKLRDAGVEFWIADLNRDALEVVERSTFGQTLGHERMFFNLQQAVDAYTAPRDSP